MYAGAYLEGLWGPGPPGVTKGAPKKKEKRKGKEREKEKEKGGKEGKGRKSERNRRQESKNELENCNFLIWYPIVRSVKVNLTANIFQCYKYCN